MPKFHPKPSPRQIPINQVRDWYNSPCADAYRDHLRSRITDAGAALLSEVKSEHVAVGLSNGQQESLKLMAHYRIALEVFDAAATVHDNTDPDNLLTLEVL